MVDNPTAFCPFCRRYYTGPKCVVCGGDNPNYKPDTPSTTQPTKWCKECGGRLIDITVSCPRWYCDKCGKEDI